MNAKTFLFVGAWMKPLKTLPLEQRWNVMEAIIEYATTGQITKNLDPMETIAFLFIRNGIDRMNTYRKVKSERRRSAIKDNHEKAQETYSVSKIDETNDAEDAYDTNNANDANACKAMQEDSPFDIISVSESVSESKSESNKKSTTTRVRVRGNARKEIFSGIQPLYLNLTSGCIPKHHVIPHQQTPYHLIHREKIPADWKQSIKIYS